LLLSLYRLKSAGRIRIISLLIFDIFDIYNFKKVPLSIELALQRAINSRLLRRGLSIQNYLFPNTKPPEYIPQYFVVGDFAGDGAQVVQGVAQVGGEQVAADAYVNALFDNLKR
jgi:hypothetical protein